MKVFVTGGTGFMGHAVVAELLQRGHQVRCLRRATSSIARIDFPEIEWVVGDILDPASLEPGIADCDGVIHLASISDWRDVTSPEIQKIAVQGSQNMLDACLRAGKPGLRVVFISSISAINGTDKPELINEQTPYTIKEDLPFARTKLEMEQLCWQAAKQGLAVMVANPPETVGPNDTALITGRNLINLLKTNPVLVTHGGNGIGYVYDVAAGIVAILEKGRAGERYILSGDNITVRQLAEMTLEILGVKRRIVTVPTWLVRGGTRLATRLGIKLPYTPEIIPYATRYWYMDNSKARQELGINFRSARETLEPTIAWLREAGHFDGYL